mmetsp:Transcript_31410/g.46413  ORF Transcript_31410/g.46413 Transcript_31410/m.46413 type:complete len:470 (-) Transcript_31410:608-2017(-)
MAVIMAQNQCQRLYPKSFESTKIVSVLDKAVNSIESILNESKHVREKRKDEHDALLATYKADIELLDQEQADACRKKSSGGMPKVTVDHLESYHDENSCQEKGSITPSTSHALNFHLKQKVNGEEIFILPPETNGCNNASDGKLSKNNFSINHSIASSSHESSKQRQREIFFQKLEEMQKAEIELEKRLHGDDSDNNTNRERQDLLHALEKCRARNCDTVLSLIANYKPRLKKSSKHNLKQTDIAHLGLNISSIENMLKEIEEQVSVSNQSRTHQFEHHQMKVHQGCDEGTVEHKDLSPSTRSYQRSHVNKYESEKSPLSERLEDAMDQRSCSKNHTFTSAERPTKAVELDESAAIVLNDPYHLTKMQDLPVETAETTTNSEAERNTLKNTIQSNTYPVDPLFPSLDIFRSKNDRVKTDFFMPGFQSECHNKGATQNAGGCWTATRAVIRTSNKKREKNGKGANQENNK